MAVIAKFGNRSYAKTYHRSHSCCILRDLKDPREKSREILELMGKEACRHCYGDCGKCGDAP